MSDDPLASLNDLYDRFSSDKITRDQFRQGLAEHGYWESEIDTCCQEMFARKYRERQRASRTKIS